MAAKKGHEKAGGRVKGTPNKRTVQWEAFTEYCLTGGLEKFEDELNKLEGKDFIIAFTSLLEFHKPKLARTDIDVKSDGEKMQTTIVINTTPDIGKNLEGL